MIIGTARKKKHFPSYSLEPGNIDIVPKNIHYSNKHDWSGNEIDKIR